MDYEKARSHAEQLLMRLDKNLTYHNAWHTLNDVLPAAERLAMKMGVGNEDITLLKTAVLFHDLGYLEQYQNNEPVAVEIAQGILPDCGYSAHEIKRISSLILKTSLPQRPDTLLEKIICDADLDSLGRNDYFELSNALYLELCHFGVSLSDNKWHKQQKAFLQNHNYFTHAARDDRDSGKQSNLAELNRLLA